MQTSICTLLLLVVFFLPAQSLLGQLSVQWDKTLGGPDDDYLWTAQQTSDGGYILGGQSEHYSGLTGDRSKPSQGRTDYWLVKLAKDGRKEWDKSYGGSEIDIIDFVRQRTGLLGCKIGANGSKEWDKIFGGNGEDNLNSIIQSLDGGYMLCGTSKSEKSGDKSQGTKGISDTWIVKITASGTKQWDKTLGGKKYMKYGSYNGDSELKILKQEANGNYIHLLNSSGQSYQIAAVQKAIAGQKAEVDISGLSLSSGIYMLKIESEAASEVIKLLVTQ
ncbi:T9SS type A sorting domain-containing protein [Dyadobacter sediminis]|uniref:T9SS type A sorting domain-containing protein n=1 Tax=Dyadobacter sediminis TaxID=1493691 RepID=UPI001E40D8B1|nr:T9SS type A sorting domain-containing protein [Dyadobacter sediminis]